SSGGWQTWKTVSSSVTLPAGLQTLRLYVVDPGFTLNWFEGLNSATLVTARPGFGSSAATQEVNTLNTSLLRLYPLPARSEMTLQLNNTYTGALHVMILDEAGRLHRSLRLQKRGPEMTQRIPVNDLSRGVYLLQVEMNGRVQSQTFLKQ
ncbi:T9SS type A sorting domain-containing protein, partial [Flavisolibacter nicotianae]|uniref:T9SS type A sorting domain-containing protein n=1 Tax=Flavisolibacter nicotianae TaxID=2364882 RepID=UPI0013C466B1